VHGPDGKGSATDNIWEVDSSGNLTQLTFFDYPMKAVMPTLAAETAELVYVFFDEMTDVLSLVSERDGPLFVADPDPDANFGVFPDLSPRGLLVFYGRINGVNQVWLGIRASNGQGSVCSLGGIVCPLVPVSVKIDIMPGSFPNSINPKSNAPITVAILTTDTFDATTVDPSTVRFGATGTKATPMRFSLEDVNRDGRADLLIQFRTRDTDIACGDASAALTGQTFSGQEIEGEDAITTVGCR
jgi:hypothetical protein